MKEVKHHKQDRRTFRFLLHLNDEEKTLFKERAKRYPSVSAMVRDAVDRFDDRCTVARLESLNRLSALIKSFNTEVAKQGGNLNQAQKRANELIYSGDLNQQYYDDVILPQIQELRELLTKVSKQQTQIFKKIMKL